MQWCLLGFAMAIALLGISALTVSPVRVRPPKIRLRLVVRGCAATLCLLIAVALLGLALLTGR